MREDSFTAPATAQPGKLRGKDRDARKKIISEISVELLSRVVDAVEENGYPAQIDENWKGALTRQVFNHLDRILIERDSPLAQPEKLKVAKMVMDEILGFGPINEMIADPTVTEVMVNGPDQVYLERDGKIILSDVKFRDDAHVLHIIDKICAPLGRRIDESSPMVDARLPDGSRVNAIIHPLSIKGPCLTIRKFAAIPFTLDDLLSFGTYSAAILSFLGSCIRGRINMLISGGTDSGKTTLLNVLSEFIPPGERIVTIEDAAELQFKQHHVLPLEARPPNIEGKGLVTIRDLVINSLRMRPDRIIVGEVRGGEALDMLQAMNTGHDGSITTLHANSPRDALARIETMVLMAGMDLPHRAIREQVASAIELVVHTSRFTDGSRKVVRISEVLGLEGTNYSMQDLFIFNSKGMDDAGRIIGEFEATGIMPTFLDKLELAGEKIQRNLFCSRKSSAEKTSRGRY